MDAVIAELRQKTMSAGRNQHVCTLMDANGTLAVVGASVQVTPTPTKQENNVEVMPTVDCSTPAEKNLEARPTIRDEEVDHVSPPLSARKPHDAIDQTAEPLRTSMSEGSKLTETAKTDRPPLAPGSSRPPVPCDRAPLAAVAVPQPTAFSDRPPLAPGNSHDAKTSLPGQGGYPVIPMLQLHCAGEELSTRAPSCASTRSCRNPSSSPSARSPRNPGSSPGRSPRSTRNPASSPGRSPRGSPCQSPRPNPTSPRSRMRDVMHGPRSIIRYPDERKEQHSSVMHMTPRGPRTFTDIARVPRNLAGDHHYQRAGLRASNDCLEMLKGRQMHTRVEDVVENLLLEQENPINRADYQYARARLRQSSYRDATVCATSMAGRTKRQPMSSPVKIRL